MKKRFWSFSLLGLFIIAYALPAPAARPLPSILPSAASAVVAASPGFTELTHPMSAPVDNSMQYFDRSLSVLNLSIVTFSLFLLALLLVIAGVGLFVFFRLRNLRRFFVASEKVTRERLQSIENIYRHAEETAAVLLNMEENLQKEICSLLDRIDLAALEQSPPPLLREEVARIHQKLQFKELFLEMTLKGADHLVEGLYFLFEGSLERAEAAFNKAVKTDPGLAQAWLFTGDYAG